MDAAPDRGRDTAPSGPAEPGPHSARSARSARTESFDAASVPARQRRHTWSAVTARFLIPLQIDAPSATVDGTIAARRREEFTLCGLSATAHTAVRTAGPDAVLSVS